MMQEPGSGPATPREAAKEFLHAFALLDWTVESIPTRANSMGWEAQRGGSIEDEAGKPRQLTDRQLAITRLGGSRCYAVFEIVEIMNEIRRQGRGEDVNTSRCRNCGAPLVNARKGRNRLFCDNKNRCKQAYHRGIRRDFQDIEKLQAHPNLLDYWQQHHITDELLNLLENILLEWGEEAARAATEAILSYTQEQTQRASADQPQPEQAKASRPRRPRKPEA